MKKNKLIDNIKHHPTDLTYQDVNSLLGKLGYEKIKSKGTNMVYQKGKKKVSFHIPHRYETFQAYQITKLLKLLVDDLDAY